MSLLGDLLNKIPGLGGDGPSLDRMKGVFSDLLGEGGRGLSNLMHQFDLKGMGDKVRSWVGDGPRLPITAEQVKQVFGLEQLQALATRANTTVDRVVQTIADHLPTLVNELATSEKRPDQPPPA